MEAPKSYFVMDPGRKMGFASCLAGGAKLRSGTWRFTQKLHGACFADYLTRLKVMLADLPDCQVGMELMTIVTHEDARGLPRVDAEQVMFSSGWPTHTQTILFTKDMRELEMIPIQSWRSKTHGYVTTPKGSKMDQNARAAWFKEKAMAYCDANGWEYDSPDEAEALCMLDYLRQLHEPGYAFERGRVFEHHQPVLF